MCKWSRVLQHDKVCAGELGSNGLEIFQFFIQPGLLNHLSKCLATKKGLLWGVKIAAKAQKTAAKGPFGLLWWGLLRRFHLLALHCRNSSIMVVTKNTTINAPFSSVFWFFVASKKPPPYAVKIRVNWLLVAGYARHYRKPIKTDSLHF